MAKKGPPIKTTRRSKWCSECRHKRASAPSVALDLADQLEDQLDPTQLRRDQIDERVEQKAHHATDEMTAAQAFDYLQASESSEMAVKHATEFGMLDRVGSLEGLLTKVAYVALEEDLHALLRERGVL